MTAAVTLIVTAAVCSGAHGSAARPDSGRRAPAAPRASVLPPASPLSPPEDAATATAFLTTWCLDCHDGSRAKGRVNLEGVVARLSREDRSVEDADLLRRAHLRVADGIMPPADADQPSSADRAAAAPALARLTRVAPEHIIPPGTAPRRLNRVEYANTVRDLFGVDVAEIGALPPDDVGAGFDNVASVLSLSPAVFERMLEIAEGVAVRACPDQDAEFPAVQRVRGRDLSAQGSIGRAVGRAMSLWSNGQAERALELPRDGIYAIAFTGFGQQAGPEPVRCAIVVDGKPVAEFELPEKEAAPGTRRVEVRLRGGTRRVGVAFLNDFYKPGPPPEDRNMAVQTLVLEGPLDRSPPPAWRHAMDAACAAASTGAASAPPATGAPSIAAPTNAGSGGTSRSASAPVDAHAVAQHAWLVRRVLRRPATSADHALLAQVAAAAPDQGDARLRAAIVALLVHPEFLLRIEADPPAGTPVRDLAPHEIATRLSYYLWASTPDEELSRAADSGALSDPTERARQVERLLRDPRASALAERFAPQWLGMDGLETRMPDATQFPGVDPALMQAMRSETVLFFDTVLREARPATELLDADYTFMDTRLAAHYGAPAPATQGMRRVPAPADRGGGVLAHASVLLATSNPTRTSPVKRGKWVLESLLDSAPPPPPPGTPQLAERAEDRHGLTLRAALELHRQDPACAACHRRMDALGFAFEHYDAVGRRRERAEGAPVDARGELPDGRRVASLADLRAVIARDPAFVRSLTKHLLVYATGREASPADEAAVDAIVAALGPNPTLRGVVKAVTESPAFLRRGAPSPAAAPPATPPPVQGDA